MRVKKGFKIRTVCGENIVFAEGIENVDFSKIISMNESAAYLWKEVQDRDFDAGALAELLVGRFDVDEATALNDSQALLEQWTAAGIVE